MVDILQDDITKIINNSNIKTFGLIIYTDENPNIVKLLRDEDNWKALSRVSGEKFFIFSVKPKKGYMGFPDFPPGTIGMMVQMWKEPNENNKLFDHLNIKDSRELPLFVVFTKVDEYLLYKSMSIDESDPHKALEQLKEIFYQIRDVTDKIHTDYKEHEAQVHDKIALVLQQNNAWKIMKNFHNLVKVVKTYKIF
ncbi:MAG TPA: hypothetical protein EYG73_08020 [Arcobacter sp.]|nr:hypothetical protein [Arcobacter sp.]